VLDDDERVVGVISEYDLMVRIGREGKKQSEKDDGMFPKIGRCDEFGGASSPPIPALEKPQPDISFTRRFRLSTKSFTGTEPLEARSTDD
jgi:hypothetical protein